MSLSAVTSLATHTFTTLHSGWQVRCTRSMRDSLGASSLPYWRSYLSPRFPAGFLRRNAHPPFLEAVHRIRLTSRSRATHPGRFDLICRGPSPVCRKCLKQCQTKDECTHNSHRPTILCIRLYVERRRCCGGIQKKFPASDRDHYFRIGLYQCDTV